MSAILAVETATEACSLALMHNGSIVERHEVIPRMHSRRLFALMQELLAGHQLAAETLTAVAYGAGPGSFTGLRIAASFTQGVCFARHLPAVPVSSLATIAQTALGEGLSTVSESILVVLDARIDEVYSALYRYEGGCAVPVERPRVCSPGQLDWAADGDLHVLVSGNVNPEALPPQVLSGAAKITQEVLPRARHMFPLVQRELSASRVQTAEQVQPDYVQDEVSWKKLSEQGKR